MKDPLMGVGLMNKAEVVGIQVQIRKEARMGTLLVKVVIRVLMAKLIAAKIDRKILILIC
jgi:hypothetical protein